MDIMELYDKKNQLWQKTKNFLDEHTDKDGRLSKEDAATYDRMESEIKEVSNSIERYKRKNEMEKQFAQPTAQPILNNPQNNLEVKTGKLGVDYKNALLSAIRSKFTNVSNLLNEGTDSQGGYLVPTEWDSRLIDTLDEENVMRKLGTKITTAREHKINVVASKPAAVWVAEGGSLTFGNATFSQKTLDAHKLHVGVRISNELLYDNVYKIEDYLIGHFAKALGNAEEDAFINGNGVGKPTGLLTAAAADTDSTVTTAGNAIAADDIINLIYELKRPYRKNACFLMNDSTLATVRKLKDNNQAYMWQASYQAGEPDRLLGYPIYTSAYMPTVAAGNSVIAFGDFSYYNIGDRGTRSFRQLNEKFADTDETAFLMIERVDGVLTLSEAIKVLKVKGGA